MRLTFFLKMEPLLNFKGLRYYKRTNKKNAVKPALIYGGNKDQRRGAFDIFSYKNIETINMSENRGVQV
jgi:hypothetical protein